MEAAAYSRHRGIVRITHWLTAAAFLALLVSGLEIVISHPRFYWGETGNVGTAPLFKLPIPSSRATVPTGYGFVLPDQNGWSRNLHFQSAWLAVFTGLVYLGFGFSRRKFSEVYNPIQRATYAIVIFVLFPVITWTGLAMSPAFDAAVPFAAAFWGGRQSARTIHFAVTLALAFFLLVHVVRVVQTGFKVKMRAML